MSKLKKTIEKILNKKNVSFEDLDYILRTFGYDCRCPKGGSSHYSYFKKGITKIITIPKKKPIKEVYIKKVIELLDLEEYYNENY